MSDAMSLNEIDWKKLGMRVLVFGGSAAAIAVLQVFQVFDFGVYSPIVATAAGLAIETIRKFTANSNYTDSLKIQVVGKKK